MQSEHTQLRIRTYTDSDRDEIIRLVLHCQNDGTRPPVTVSDQPELLHINEKYMESGGCFWVAMDGGRLAGCIGLIRRGENGILKKFFVYEPYRSAPHHLGRQLYETLLAFARENGVKTLYLDTPKNTHRAHRFYEKAGFQKIDQSELPFRYDFPYKDSDFFRLPVV
ncbi:MAG: GNAT family N-acetyltransferase [Clostridiales bacterium]|nr:GNAT family N-acetyltransferase [Clostridiales bacterium]